MLAETRGILAGIDATMATIEFTPKGEILTANEKFLQTVKYRLEEIKQKHHRMFVPSEVLESDDYQNFWTQLGRGEPISGTFKRVSSAGDTIWLNAIYNPILDVNGRVMKVVKFATDITPLHEKVA